MSESASINLFTQHSGLSRNVPEGMMKAVKLHMGLATLWLFVAILCGVISLFKLTTTSFLQHEFFYFLTYGRIAPVMKVALLFGWLIPSIQALALWYGLVAHQGKTIPGVTVMGSLLWHGAVKIAAIGILAGASSGQADLAMPAWAWFPLLFAALMLAYSIYNNYRAESEQTLETKLLLHAQVVLVALLGFAWVFLGLAPGNGVITAANTLWLHGALINVVILPSALALGLFVFHQVTGKKVIATEHESLFFWSLILLGYMQGWQNSFGGPLPAWMPALSGASSMMMLLPAGMLFLGLQRCRAMEYVKCYQTRLLLFGFLGYLLYVLGNATLFNAWFGGLGLLSYAWNGVLFFALVNAASVLLLSAQQYALGQLHQQQWGNMNGVRTNFWFVFYGTLCIGVLLISAGLFQNYFSERADQWALSTKTSLGATEGFSKGILLGYGIFFIGLLSYLRGLIPSIFGFAPPSSSKH